MPYKKRTWAAIERQRSGYRKLFRKVFQKALDYQIEPFLKEIKHIDINNTTFSDVEIDNTKIEGAYLRLYRTVAKEFAIDERERALKAVNGNYQKKDAWNDEFERLIEEYMSLGIAGQNIRIIGNTSKEYLAKLVNELIVEIRSQGLGIGAAQTMLRDRLTSEWHRAMRYRTERIVRTEISAASNWGSLEGIKSTGLPHNKFWVSAFDERTRDSHIGVQFVDINEPFQVGSDLMMHPGDGSLGASAGNIINCRCAVTFQLKSMLI